MAKSAPKARNAAAHPHARYRSLVCDTHHKPLFPFEQLGLDGGNQSNLPISCQIDRLAANVSFRSLLQAREGLAPILGLGGPRYFPTVDGQLSFAPRSDVDLELVLPDGRKELLYRSALTNGQVLVWLPIGCT